MFNLGFFGSHNAAVAISFQGKVLEVVELERLIDFKNAAFFFWDNHPNTTELLTEVEQYFRLKYNVEKYDNVVYNSVKEEYFKIFPANYYQHVLHHHAHAYSGLYQSPFKKALIISCDGGSDEGFFNVYIGEKHKDLQKIYSGKKDYAISYMMPAHYIKEIKQENIFIGNLVYAGKIMGLAGFGQVREEFIQPLIDFYNSNTSDSILKSQEHFLELFNKFGIKNNSTRFEGTMSHDLAATNQYVFEKLFQEETQGILEQYPDLPLILVGGCALNIINNTKIAKTKELFVPPNPNDCGLAVGLVASKIKPSNQIDCTYLGSEVRDKNELTRILFERKGVKLNINKLSDEIISGKIVGVVRGRCEQGPRALGNRSIICDPTIDGMKDTLNARVKGREYYRPFAPVVRLEDVNKYFEWDRESKWMGYCPAVREEYKDILKAITHIDGTARVQTVTREQNPFLYNLLTIMSYKKGIGVLLNTSFNIAGRPILNSYKDALWVLDNKDMDAVVLEDYYITK